jgi:hypothetical protein
MTSTRAPVGLRSFTLSAAFVATERRPRATEVLRAANCLIFCHREGNERSVGTRGGEIGERRKASSAQTRIRGLGSSPDSRIGGACPSRSTPATRHGGGGRASGRFPSRGSIAPTAFAREPAVPSARAVRRDARATKTRHRSAGVSRVAAVRVRARAVNASERRTLTEPSAAEEERVKADIFVV